MNHERQANSSYIATTGSKAAQRLALQHRVFELGTKKLLNMSGFRPDMQVLIVGSGGGDETCMLASELEGTGHVIAIDKSEEQTKQTQQAVDKAGLTSRVTCITKAVEDVSSENGRFDLIFCRFILPHLHNPFATIGALKALLKPDGVLASQEPIISECWSTPDSPALKQYLALMLNFATTKGLDFDLAKRIPDLFQQNGLITKHQHWQPIVLGDDKRMLTMSAIECLPAIIGEQLITKTDADKLIEALRQEVVESDAALHQCTNVLTIGRNPSPG